jgi:hypothetical protein
LMRNRGSRNQTSICRDFDTFDRLCVTGGGEPERGEDGESPVYV